jgi:uncharacterized protein YyaL (SSP411 family)
MERAPRAFATSLCVIDFLLEGPTEIALVGKPGSDDTEALARALSAEYLPNRILSPIDPAVPERTPLGRGKELVAGQAAVYICRNFACEAPVTSPEALQRALSQDRLQRVRGKAVG